MFNLVIAEVSKGMVMTYAVIVFLTIIIGLIIIIQFAEKKLKPQGKAKLSINGEDPIDVDRGSTLLSTLMGEKILLPSACGGGGTCAMCRCKVIEGGGDVLPTEKGHLTLNEQRDHVRLACQVKVRDDMKIEVPAEIFFDQVVGMYSSFQSQRGNIYQRIYR